MFITSGFEVKELSQVSDKAISSEYYEGIRTEVEVAKGIKCERCWMYSETVGNHEDHPTICTRCYNNIK